jgi:hypothetical protein
MLTGRKLALTLAFTVLVAVAFGAGCRGFFPKPTIASFVISPTNSTVPFPNGVQQMAAFGTDTDGQPTGNITSKISWSSSDPGVITIGDASIAGTTPGLMTAVAQSTAPITITANYQALAAQTATAAVCVVGASNLAIVPIDYVDNTGATSATYTASVTVNGVGGTDVTASAKWTTTNTAVTIADGTTPAIATITLPTAQTKGTVTATYTCGGNTLTATTNITVDPKP